MRTTTANDHRSKSVFELSDEELQERLRPTGEAIVQKIWSNNGYITYHDQELCPDTEHMIHEYRDHKELVRIDKEGRSHFVKTL